MYIFKLLIDEGGDKPAVASTIVDHLAACEITRASAQKAVDSGIPVFNLE
jgi:hypothetical protein